LETIIKPSAREIHYINDDDDDDDDDDDED
jgi:hypothetical protein